MQTAIGMSSGVPEPAIPRTPEELRSAFDVAPAHAVGIEDEVMLLDPRTLELVPKASVVLALVENDPRFKLELPASQLEIVTPPCETVSEAVTALSEARHDLVAAANDEVSFAAAGAHPFSSGVGELNRGPRYEEIVRRYGWVAERQLVCALQIHVSTGDGERALAVYNAARSYLPYLAALAASAPFHEGVDTGLASVRPKIAELLPRQGVPPAIPSWESYLDALTFGRAADAFAGMRTWWWELRLHPRFGTLEFRVPDAQCNVRGVAAIAAVVQSLVAWLGAQHDAGEKLLVDPSWRIEENRWSACRDGVLGAMADLRTGRPTSTRECLQRLFEELLPTADALGVRAELEQACQQAEINNAIAQRRVARDGGGPAIARWLTERFLDDYGG